MDTIGYRRDPADPSTMVNVLKLYPRLNQSEIKEESEWCLTKFDSYDKMNDSQAKKYLLASLNSTLEKEVDYRSEESDTFVDLLFHLIDEERPATMYFS